MAHLVTGYAGAEHITSADQGSFNASFFGTGQFVMEAGRQFAASIVDNNTVRVSDGDMLMQGRHIRIPPDVYEDMVITTGTAGKDRVDIICMTYEKNNFDGTEKAFLEVIRGTETEGAAQPPGLISGNILEGADKNQMALYRVTIRGVVLSGIECLFETTRALSCIMVGATAEGTGKAGLVPTPGKGDQEKVLKGDGTWGLIENLKNAFSKAATRTNLASGESLKVSLGKIMKWFDDFKTVAFSGSYTDLSNTPTTMKNPQALTFTGRATGSYDGSAAKTVAIPSKTSELTNDSGFKTTDTNTWRGIQNNLTSDSTTDSLSAAQGKALKGMIDAVNTGLNEIADKMYSIGTSKPTSGYTVYSDSYLHRGRFGQVDISLNVSATTVKDVWTIVGFVETGYRPSQFKELSGYALMSNGVPVVVNCYIYNDGNIKVYNRLDTGNYNIHVFGSYFIWD